MRNYRSLIFLPLLVIIPLIVDAQDKPTVPPPGGVSSLPLNFLPPGARALGMGGAFLGIADDATASEANPAGLIILTRPEVSIHFRDSSFDIVNEDPLAESIDDIIDGPIVSGNTIPKAIYANSVSEVSFASFVKPFSNWAFSIYYQQPANFEGESRFTRRDDFFIDDYTSRVSRDLLLETFGASVAFKIGSRFSFGFSLRQSQLELRAVDELRIDWFLDVEDPFSPNPNFDHLDFFGDRQVFDGDDSDLTYNAGILINPNGKFSVGLVYKESGDYTIDSRVEEFFCFEMSPTGPECSSAAETNVTNVLSADKARISIPDVFGIGFAWRPSDHLTIAWDMNQITYADFSAGVTEEVDDELEFHFGLEYTFLAGGGNTPISLRGGFWTDSDHDGFASIDSDQEHVTAGIGIVLKKLQFDVAGHFSDTVDEGLVSLVYRF
jgi:long-chain fatty acid transport protein